MAASHDMMPAEQGESACSVLRLYIAGQTPRSLLAVENMQHLCASLLGAYQLEVIDLYQQPHLALSEQLVALPAVVKRLPPPARMVVGDMSDPVRVMAGLKLRQP